MGEDEGGGGQEPSGPDLVPPPLHPLPRWGGEFFTVNVRNKLSDFVCKNLHLFRDFARKRCPFGAVVNECFILRSVGIYCRREAAPPVNEGATN